MMTRCALVWILVGVFGCAEDAPVNDSDEVAQLAQQFVDDSDFRREVLESSFVNPNNGYAELRLARYTDTSWGELEVWNPPTQPVRLGRTPDAGAGLSIDVESVPWTPEALRALGEEAFFNFPGQINHALHAGLEDPLAYGLDLSGDRIDTLVWVTTPTGHSPAVTCATCHSHRDALGVRVPGKPNAGFNYGAMMSDYYGTGLDWDSWGPGRVDVTNDEIHNPTAITDLRPVAFQNYLHRAGTLHNDLAALAVRIETLMITSRGQRKRPPRKIAFALAYYLWTLSDDLAEPDWTHPGAEVFKSTCAGCHAGEGLVGALVPLEVIGTPSEVGASPERGTGHYRVPSLRGVGDRSPLFAGGSVQNVVDLLNPDRSSPGHRFGLDLSETDRENLMAFLRQL